MKTFAGAHTRFGKKADKSSPGPYDVGNSNPSNGKRVSAGQLAELIHHHKRKIIGALSIEKYYHRRLAFRMILSCPKMSFQGTVFNEL
jgi:hypothetical protein